MTANSAPSLAELIAAMAAELRAQADDHAARAGAAAALHALLLGLLARLFARLGDLAAQWQQGQVRPARRRRVRQAMHLRSGPHPGHPRARTRFAVASRLRGPVGAARRPSGRHPHQRSALPRVSAAGPCHARSPSARAPPPVRLLAWTPAARRRLRAP